MSLNKLEDVVRKNAEDEAAGLLTQSKTAAEADWQRESARLRDEHLRRMAAMESALRAEVDRAVSTREAEERMKLLSQRNEIMAQVFQKAAAGIAASGDVYRAWLKHQVARLPRQGTLKIVVNQRDRDLMAALLRESGAPGLALSEQTSPITGGFIAVGEQTDLDFSVDAIMNVLRETMIEDVAKRLFEN